jgi:hypothetical protein
MQKEPKIPVLTDLIDEGVEIELSELGLDPEQSIGDGNLANSLEDNPALEQEIRRILDEHMELAWQEIRIAIQRVGVKSSSE